MMHTKQHRKNIRPMRRYTQKRYEKRRMLLTPPVVRAYSASAVLKTRAMSTPRA